MIPCALIIDEFLVNFSIIPFLIHMAFPLSQINPFLELDERSRQISALSNEETEVNTDMFGPRNFIPCMF